MKTIAEQLIQLNQIKSDIKQAIIDKGVAVSDNDGFATYPDKISAISGGGGLSYVTGMKFCSSVFSELPSQLQGMDWQNVENMQYFFRDCTSLTSISLSRLDNVSNLSYCFYNCRKLKSVTLSGLGNVSIMADCFNYCSALSSVSLIDLDGVATLGSCFANCTSLNHLTLPSLWNVTSLIYCFSGCGIMSITLSGLSKVQTMYGCFRSCNNLREITLSGLSVITEMGLCFSNCMNLRDFNIDSFGSSITALTNWGISTCTQITKNSLLNIINALYTTNVTRTCTIGTTNLSKLSAAEIAIATNKGWTLN